MPGVVPDVVLMVIRFPLTCAAAPAGKPPVTLYVALPDHPLIAVAVMV